jgi:hypothetical protein
VNASLRQEVEEFRQLARGTDPATGKPFRGQLHGGRGRARASSCSWNVRGSTNNRGGLRRHVLATVDRRERSLHGVISRNFTRWPVLQRRIWPDPRARGSYRAETRFLRSWLTRRIAWIDRKVASAA